MIEGLVGEEVEPQMVDDLGEATLRDRDDRQAVGRHRRGERPNVYCDLAHQFHARVEISSSCEDRSFRMGKGVIID